MKNIWLDMAWVKKELPLGTRVRLEDDEERVLSGFPEPGATVIGYRPALRRMFDNRYEYRAAIRMLWSDGQQAAFFLDYLERE